MSTRRVGPRRRRLVVVLSPLVVGSLVVGGCGSELGGEDPSGGEEAETAVSNEDEAEARSLGEIRELVEQRAQEAGLTGGEVQCVLDYLDETFDDALVGEEADLAIDEAFGACSTDPTPRIPLEPDEPSDGG